MQYSIDSLISLISHIHTATADFTNRKLTCLSPQYTSITSSHGFILYLLSIEGSISKGELSKRINRDKSTTTVLIRKLIKEGLVKEETDKSDSRIKRISLTDKGISLNDITKSISKDLLKVCYKDFSEEEKLTLLKLLCKMNDNIEAE